MAIDFDWDEYEDGRTALLFTPPRLAAFADAGLHGDGHDWERVLLYFLPRVAPKALEGTDFDSESDLFSALNKNPLMLQKLAAVVSSLVEDQDSLRIVLKGMLRVI